MAKINLLPWREEKRKLREKNFYTGLVFAVLTAVAIIFAASVQIDVMVSYQKARNNYLSTEIKKGDYQILLPLFNSKKAFPESKGRYYLYSVIPLPKRGKNRFAFSAHLFPTEERKDVDVEGVDFVHRDWYRLLMKNICKLYSSRLPDYIAKVKALAISNEEKEEIILNSLPNDILPEWMRPGKEVLSNWWEVTHKKTIQALK